MTRFSDASQRATHTAEPTAVLRYFPLQVRYVWTYAERVLSATQSPLLQRQVTLTVQSHHNDEYVAHWDFQSGRTDLPNVRYRIRDDGVQQAQLTGDTSYTPFAYLLKAPLVVGTMWRSIQGYRVQITALDVVCEVPAGAFTGCLETSQDAEPAPENRMLTRRYFASGVGLVWQQRRLFQQTALVRTDTMELQKLPEPLRL